MSMQTLLVQRGTEQLAHVSDALNPCGHQLQMAPSSDFSAHIKQLGASLAGVVLSNVNEQTHAHIKLIRNGRHCHPWVPVAVINEQPGVLASNIGCHYFATDNLAGLGAFLAAPLLFRVLVVEDDPSITDVLSQALAKHYDVTTAADAETGQALLQAHHYDLAIFDHKLPGPMSGLDLVKWVRSEAIDMPIITITAYDNSDRELNSFTDGADEYLTKPFHSIASLRKTILHVLTERSMRHDAIDANTLRQDLAWDKWREKMTAFTV